MPQRLISSLFGRCPMLEVCMHFSKLASTLHVGRNGLTFVFMHLLCMAWRGPEQPKVAGTIKELRRQKVTRMGGVECDEFAFVPTFSSKMLVNSIVCHIRICCAESSSWLSVNYSYLVIWIRLKELCESLRLYLLLKTNCTVLSRDVT